MRASAGLLVALWSLSLSSIVTAEPFVQNSPSTAFHSRLPCGLSCLLQLRGGEEAVEEAILDLDTSTTADNDTTTVLNLTFPLCKPGDGSDTDKDGLPGRYLRMQKHHRHKAKHALKASLKWREKHEVDTILARPHPKFDACKRVLPHYFAGRDPTDHVVFVQRPGKIQMPFAHYNNVTTDDLLMHYVYVLEYCWNILEPRPDQTMTSVIDLGGLNLKAVRQMFKFVKLFVNMMSLHYPQRSYKTLLVNAPRWFKSIYRMIAPILRESTRSKIEIYSGGPAQKEALIKYLAELAPKELLDDDEDDATSTTTTVVDSNEENQGENATAVQEMNAKLDHDEEDATTTTVVESNEEENQGENATEVQKTDATGPNSPMEQALRAFCLARLKEANEVMQPVLELPVEEATEK